MREHILNNILILCEQLGDNFGQLGQRKPDYYLNPIIRWLTQEWKKIKKLLVNYSIDIALEKITSTEELKLEAVEEIFFPEGKQNLIFQMIELLVGKMADETKEKVKEAKSKARSDERKSRVDAGGYFQLRTSPTTVLLSKEGLEAVVANLNFQKDFVDDLSLSTQKRIGKLLRARYGSIGDFRTQITHALRVNRDDILDNFHSSVDDIAERLKAGKISSVQFQDDMLSSIKKHYRQAYREGKGSPLVEWEEELIKKQVESQRQYLDNFRNLIDQKKILGDELTSYVNWRSGLYAERGSSLFEAGVVQAWSDDVLIDWVLGVADHCPTCPIYATNSPYIKATIPGYPGEGFHLTICGTNCKCHLEISDLYVTKFPELK